MNTESLTYLVVGALLVFWAVGAHNRLVRLKNAVGKEYGSVDAHLRQRQALLAQLLQMESHRDEPQMLQVMRANQAVQQSMELLRQRPYAASEAVALQESEYLLDQALGALWSGPVMQEVARKDASLRQLVMDLAQLDERVDLATAPYNRAVEVFNEAVTEFPAWLIAKLVGFQALPLLQLSLHSASKQAARPLMVGRRESDAWMKAPN